MKLTEAVEDAVEDVVDAAGDVAKAVVCISNGCQQLVQPCRFSPAKRPLFAPADYGTERCTVCADDSSADEAEERP